VILLHLPVGNRIQNISSFQEFHVTLPQQLATVGVVGILGVVPIMVAQYMKHIRTSIMTELQKLSLMA
jgi:hypothetical protein